MTYRRPAPKSHASASTSYSALKGTPKVTDPAALRLLAELNPARFATAVGLNLLAAEVRVKTNVIYQRTSRKALKARVAQLLCDDGASQADQQIKAIIQALLIEKLGGR